MLETYASSQDLFEAAAEGVARALRHGLAARSRVSLVATGGRMPGPVYDLLAAPQRNVDWSRVVVTLSDERCVDETSPDSNARLVRERLLQGEAGRADFIGLWPKPAAAALKALTPFDAVILGMGEDGHIASLLPGDPNLAVLMDPEGEALLADVPAGLGSPPLARISLTFAALMRSQVVFLLIAGEAKRQVIARAEAGADLPVGHLIAQARVPLRILWTP